MKLKALLVCILMPAAALGQSSSPSGSGITSVGAVGASPNANASSVLEGVLTLQPANGANPGLLSSAQFTVLGNISGSNSGDVTIGNFGASPTAKGISISSQALTLQPADATRPGAVSLGAQTLGSGTKTVDALIVTAEAKANSALLEVSTPSAPAAGVAVSAVSSSGRVLPAFRGPTGTARSLQPGLARGSIGYVKPHGNTTSTTGIAFGFNWNKLGTATGPNVAVTNALTQSRRLVYTSSASAGSTAAFGGIDTQWWRGDAASFGGFYVVMRFGMSVYPASPRWFVGMSSTGVLALTSIEPSAMVSIVGACMDTTDTTIQFCYNDGSGTATKVDTTLAAPVTTGLYEVTVWAAPNASSVSMSVEKLVDGSTPTLSGALSSNIPATTTLVTPTMYVNNSATASAIALDVVSLYIEADY